MDNLIGKVSDTMLSFEKDDKLGLNGFAEDLEAYIETESHFVEGSLVVSLSAPFGFGKSTFIKMWSTSLAERRKTNLSLPIPIILNIWESDHCRDPLLAIISGLSRELRKHAVPEDKIARIREATKDVTWFGLGLANTVISDVTGLDAFAAGEIAEKKRAERTAEKYKRVDLLASYEQRAAALDELRTLLQEVFQPNRTRAIVMVDELDRCRPDYAVEFLEAIKHIFSTQGVVFILAVDKDQLRSSVRTLYGNDLNFDEYYRKFAHRNLTLPSANPETVRNLIRHYWDRVVIDGVLRTKALSAATLNETIGTSLQEISASLKLGPRQIHEMLRIYGHVMARKTEKKGDLFWGFNVCAALMTGLTIGSPTLYHSIGNKTATFHNLWETFPTLLSDKDHGEWWLSFLGSGGAFLVSSYDELLAQTKSVGLHSGIENGEQLKRSFLQHASAWGHWPGENPFRHVYLIIERLRRFENPPSH